MLSKRKRHPLGYSLRYAGSWDMKISLQERLLGGMFRIENHQDLPSTSFPRDETTIHYSIRIGVCCRELRPRRSS